MDLDPVAIRYDLDKLFSIGNLLVRRSGLSVKHGENAHAIGLESYGPALRIVFRNDRADLSLRIAQDIILSTSGP